MKYLSWLLKAAIFFTLFAFALNNQQTIGVNFFFGTVWRAPLVLVVLAAFSIGLGLGVLLMMPRWWKNKKTDSLRKAGSVTSVAKHKDIEQGSELLESSGIPRHGL